MASRRQFLRITSLLAITSLGGCVTGRMHGNDRNTYKEIISSVLITEDKSILVVIGHEYHYVMSNAEKLTSILNSSIHNKIEAKFSEFTVETDNTLTGRIELSASVQKPDEINETIRLGFVKYTNGLSQKIEIKGIRYSAGNFKNKEKVQLNKEYTILVTEPEGAVKKVMKIAATPVTVAVDGVLVIFGLSLLLLVCSGENQCK